MDLQSRAALNVPIPNQNKNVAELQILIDYCHIVSTFYTIDIASSFDQENLNAFKEFVIIDLKLKKHLIHDILDFICTTVESRKS